MAKFNNIYTSSLANSKDLLTSWQFQVIIDVSTSSPLTNVFKSDELLLRARTAKIPGKSFGVLETNFMNSKKKYKGKCVVDGQLSVEFDEFQDLYVTQVFHKWQAIMYNHGVKDDISIANGVTQGARCVTIFK